MKKSEIRKDYLSNRYVIIAPKRSKRPHQFAERITASTKDSPFTADQLKKNKNKILDSLGSGQKKILAINNIFPAVSPNNKKAYGFQEVIIETPNSSLRLAELSLEQVKNILLLYARRVKALLKPRINYILCFKNEGLNAGASLSHAHSQIFASEIVPPRVSETEERLLEYQASHGHSLYKDILKKEMSSRRKIFEDKNIAVFAPYASFYEYEVWLVTKRQVKTISDLTKAEINSLAKSLLKVLSVLKELDVPYNFFFHTTKTSGQENFCLKVEPRVHIWAGLELDSSLTVNSVEPEEAAKLYRQAFKNV